MKRTRTSFGLRGNAKHAENVAGRAAKFREEMTLRSRFKAYLLDRRDKESRRKLGKGEERKTIHIPNRKAMRKGMARQRRASSKEGS